jgi:hypothetical protein
VLVSSIPYRLSFPQGSLLRQGCGVSVAELCFAAIKLSLDDFNNDGQTFLRRKFS